MIEMFLVEEVIAGEDYSGEIPSVSRDTHQIMTLSWPASTTSSWGLEVVNIIV